MGEGSYGEWMASSQNAAVPSCARMQASGEINQHHVQSPRNQAANTPLFRFMQAKCLRWSSLLEHHDMHQ